jgi:hypothetical protein
MLDVGFGFGFGLVVRSVLTIERAISDAFIPLVSGFREQRPICASSS